MRLSELIERLEVLRDDDDIRSGVDPEVMVWDSVFGNLELKRVVMEPGEQEPVLVLDNFTEAEDEDGY